MKNFSLYFAFLICSCSQNQNRISDYSGKPFSDTKYTNGAQQIPGKIQFEYYDFGGEGVAFHDSDSTMFSHEIG